MNRIFVLGFVYVFLSLACQHKPTEVVTPNKPADTTQTGGGGKQPCDSNIIYFAKDILPILNSNCAMSGCHDNGTAADGIILTSYEKVMQSGVVTPFNLSNSDLHEVITETRPDKVMPPPPRTKLSAEQISKIEKWINQGAKNIICDDDNCDTVNISYANMISKTMQTNCIGCHGNTNPSAGITLSTYAGLSSVAANGKLVGSITHAAGFKAMPVGSKLSACEIKQVQKWVDMGYPNN
ncbi:MAG: hypothetical protein MH472_01135 [Bacteroidia bacterium]|nr:hypothetical protein [Bacteroidia bacterium]